eukprot:tig00000169_g11901.t1
MASGVKALSLMDSRMNLTDFLDRLTPTNDADGSGEVEDLDMERRAFLKDLASLEDQWKSCTAASEMSLSDFIEAAVKEKPDATTSAEAASSAVGKVGRDAAVKLLRTFGSLNTKCQSLFSEEFGVDEFIRSLQGEQGALPSPAADPENPFIAEARRAGSAGSGSSSPTLIKTPGGGVTRAPGPAPRPGAVPVAPGRPPPSVSLPAPSATTVQLIRTVSSFHKHPGALPYLEPGTVPGLPADGVPRTRSQRARVARHQRRQKRTQQREQGRRRDSSEGAEEVPEARIPRQASLLAQDRWRAQMHPRAPPPSVPSPVPLAASVPVGPASLRAGAVPLLGAAISNPLAASAFRPAPSSSSGPAPLPPASSAPAPAPSGRKRSRAASPEPEPEVNLDEMDEKKRKKWICMLRNRESAARDRARKKEHVKNLEDRNAQLESENMALRRRVAELEAALNGSGARPGAGPRRTASGRLSSK